MTLLSDGGIRRRIASGDLGITPWPRDDQFQPASIDLTLGDQFKYLWSTEKPILRPNDPEAAQPVYLDHSIASDGNLYLSPRQFVLSTTRETVSIPYDLAGRVEGKSSLGRIGLIVHITAGFIDPGFTGKITLEMYNVGPCGIVLDPGMKIAQLSFMQLDSPAQRPYGEAGLGSHYQNQQGVEGARF